MFDQYLASSRKQYKIGPLLIWNANRNLYAIHRMVPFLMILSDSVTQISRTRHYSTFNITEMVQDKDIVTIE